MSGRTTVSEISGLLDEAGEIHHHVYRITDGVDDDWATWYANWLLDLSELSELLGARPVRSHLILALVQSDRDYTSADREESWPEFYARELLRRFGAAPIS